jgi:hypothetical protein
VWAVSTTDIAGAKPLDRLASRRRSTHQMSRMNIENGQEYREALDSAAQVRIQDDVQTLVIQAAAQAQLGQPEASATIDRLRAADPGFAETPMSELRHYFLSEETVAKVAHGLRLAGLEIE